MHTEHEPSNVDGAIHDHTHRCHRSRKVSRWFFIGAGLISLVWFLCRVIPKPSRAAYPCQRAAAPVAAGFVLWLTGLLASASTYRVAKRFSRRSRLWMAGAIAAVLLVACVANMANIPRSASAAYPAIHDPIGEGKGIHPGRVVWVYNPGAVDWAGYDSSERWFESTHTNQAIVKRMLSQAIRGVAGVNDDAEAWDAIFRYFNGKHGRGDRGYQPGEKIVIKLNNGTCYQTDMYTYDKDPSVLNQIDTSPQLVVALLRQLVNVVGVNQSDITIGDPGRAYSNHIYDLPHSEFPNVRYLDFQGGSGRTKALASTTQFRWSTPAANGKLPDCVPAPYAEMDYFINLAILKGHSSGITVCGKNLYGALYNRNPDGSLPNQPGVGVRNFYDMHLSLPNPEWSPGTGKYRAVVDLMGSKVLGDKTLLCLIDGLFAGYYWESVPRRWLSSPFAGDNGWPSSIFASQDQVAIDSVAYDFLLAEWPSVVTGGVGAPGSLQGGAEDYLHEAALAYASPSTTFYDPEHDGVRMESLGVHEHWNNPNEKKYSRNRGLNEGIELLPLTYDLGSVQRAKLTPNNDDVLICGAVVTAEFLTNFYIQSDDRSMGIRVDAVSSAWPAVAVGKRVNVFGKMRIAASGERYIEPTNVTAASTGMVAPIAMTCSAVGGTNWRYDPDAGHKGQLGVIGGYGVNNIGLLVKVSGKYTRINSAKFTIEDGSGVITCTVPSGAPSVTGTRYATVTGVAACAKEGDVYTRLIRARSSADIRLH